VAFGARTKIVQCTVIIVIKVCYKMIPEKVFEFVDEMVSLG